MKLNLISPYVYWLMHKITTRRYVGSRWANKCPPLEDIGKVYFSSGPFEKDSKYEKSFKKNPDDYIIKILMTGTEEEVKKEEKRHLDGYAVKSNRYVNKCGSWPPAPLFGEDNPAKRPEVRRKISINNGMTRPEVARKVAKAQKGKKLSAEHRRKISINNGMKRPEVVKKALETKRRNREAKLRQV